MDKTECGKTCFFIGHREAGEELRPCLEEAINHLISELGVTNFIVGDYGCFDGMAASAVIKAKKRYPFITLNLLIPYHPADRKVVARDGFDGTYYPFTEKVPPKKLAIVKANEAMIHSCDYLIAYAWHPASNARNLVEKAIRLEKKGGIRVINLSET